MVCPHACGDSSATSTAGAASELPVLGWRLPAVNDFLKSCYSHLFNVLLASPPVCEPQVAHSDPPQVVSSKNAKTIQCISRVLLLSLLSVVLAVVVVVVVVAFVVVVVAVVVVVWPAWGRRQARLADGSWVPKHGWEVPPRPPPPTPPLRATPQVLKRPLGPKSFERPISQPAVRVPIAL